MNEGSAVPPWSRDENRPKGYRLGDIIRFQNIRACPEYGGVFLCKTWPDSIACKYLKKEGELSESGWLEGPAIPPKNGINFESLTEIINEFPEISKPKDDELVIHLRIGDIIDNSDVSAKQILSGVHWNESCRGRIDTQRYPSKTMTLFFYESLPLEKLNISKIILMTGSSEHIYKAEREKIEELKECGKNSESEEYVSIVKSFFEASGYNIDIRSGFSPDEDFVFACRAKMFLPSDSGFALVVEGLREYWGYKFYKTPIAAGQSLKGISVKR